MRHGQPLRVNSTLVALGCKLNLPTNLVPSGPFTITQAQGKPWDGRRGLEQQRDEDHSPPQPGPNTTNALAPGQSVSVTMSVTASVTCGAQPPIATETKQSNDSAGMGNNFTRLVSEPTLTVSPGSFAGFTWTA